MFGFGFALVPFYEKICEVTGIRNVFQPDAVPRRTPKWTHAQYLGRIRRQHAAPAWTFQTPSGSVSVRPRRGDASRVRGQEHARAAVTDSRSELQPATGGAYSGRWNASVFRQQTSPGRSAQDAGVFVIDPKLPPELNTVTLSYTFFEVNGARGGGG